MTRRHPHVFALFDRSHQRGLPYQRGRTSIAGRPTLKLTAIHPLRIRDWRKRPRLNLLSWRKDSSRTHAANRPVAVSKTGRVLACSRKSSAVEEESSRSLLWMLQQRSWTWLKARAGYYTRTVWGSPTTDFKKTRLPQHHLALFCTQRFPTASISAQVSERLLRLLTRRATKQRRPFETVVVELLASGLKNAETRIDEAEELLQALELMQDDDLWDAAKARLSLRLSSELENLRQKQL